MKIDKLLLKGGNNFKDFRYSFEDEWTGTVPASLLLNWSERTQQQRLEEFE